MNDTSNHHGGSTAICILGMHRSGTSTTTRAVNLLGAYLGEPRKLEAPGPDNPKGFWEHRGIRDVQTRLLRALDRKWDTVMPLPEGWQKGERVQPFKAELAALVGANFFGHALWAWKDPQTCLLLPLWRELLPALEMDLACVFAVRNPVDVAESLVKRNGLPFQVALGIWFHYNLMALQGAAGLPTVFVSYENLVARWEPELRRCAEGLGLAWRADAVLRAEMEAFVDPGLRHQRAPASRLQELPGFVQELYQVLAEACVQPATQPQPLSRTVQKLVQEFRAYAMLFQPVPTTPQARWHTWHRWKRSVWKRLPKPALASFAPVAGPVADGASPVPQPALRADG